MSLMIQHLDHARLGESLNYYGRRGGQLSMENFKGLAAMGHQEAALRQVVADAQRQGLSVDPELNQFLSSNTPLGTKYSVSDPASFYRPGAGVVSEAPRPTGGVFDLNQNDLAQELVRYGIRGGSLSMGDFQRLVGMGHTEAGLLEAVRAAANKYVKPLGVDADLRQYLDTGTVSERGDLEGFPGFKDTKGTAFQNTFEAMTADAETRIVRDPETREVLGYTESAGVVPLPGQEITLYDNDKQNIIGKATMPTIGGVESDQPAAPTVKYFDQPIPVDETGTPAEPEEVVEPTEPTAPERPGLVMPGIDSPVTPLAPFTPSTLPTTTPSTLPTTTPSTLPTIGSSTPPSPFVYQGDDPRFLPGGRHYGKDPRDFGDLYRPDPTAPGGKYYRPPTGGTPTGPSNVAQPAPPTLGPGAPDIGPGYVPSPAGGGGAAGGTGGGPDYATMFAKLTNQSALQQQNFQKMLQQSMLSQQRMFSDMMQRQSEEASRRMKAQQTSMANAARAGQTADIKLGSEGNRNTFGIDAFKRRLKITPQASSSLAISAPRGSTNKMLNV